MKYLKSRRRQSLKKTFREATAAQVFILQTSINLLTSIFSKIMVQIRRTSKAMLSLTEGLHLMDKTKTMLQVSINLIRMRFRAHQVALS
jgi:glutamate formiminotransferase